MSIVGYLAFAMQAGLAVYFLNRRPHYSMVAACGLAFVIQVFSTLLQIQLLSSRDADAHLYYYDFTNALSFPIAPGTSFIVYLTHLFRISLNPSFDDTNVLYSTFGLLASLLLTDFCLSFRSLRGWAWLPVSLCLLPGLHFWTSSLGKDGLSALAITLAVIATVELPRHVGMLATGLMMEVAVRPHIAAILLIAIAVGYLLRGEVNARTYGIIIAVLIAAIPAVSLLDTFLGINVLSLSEATSYIQDRQSFLATTGDLDISYIDNPLVRLVTFVALPLFAGASSPFDLAASVENTLFLFALCRLMYCLATLGFKRIRLVVAPLTYMVLTTLLLGLTSYNVGLALRQKIMLYPALIVALMICERLRQNSRTATAHL